MSSVTLALLIMVSIVVALILVVVILQRGRAAVCSRCGRAQVPGRSVCPYCQTPYVTSRRPGRSTPLPVPPPGMEVPQLVALEGPERGRRFPVTGDQFTIGRGADNRLHLVGQLVSRRHALIVFQNGQYTLYDHESTNGTYVNGLRIAQHTLRPGDRIQIGPTVLEFQLPGALPVKSPTQIPSPPVIVSPPPFLPIPRLQDYVITPLKQGGAAVIYKGVRRDGQQTVAIKVLRHADPYIRQKFADEARILHALNHPHIAKAYEYGQIDGSFYFVLEYCEGGTLRDRLVGGRALSLDFVAWVIGQTCEALDYAHRQGVIHRDIKPENIMFTAQDNVKVVDFGIAKLTGQITRTVDGMVIGTPFYLSYEQARGLPVDARSDIYSLGVVLYEMVTGRVPFQGQALEVIHKHLTELPPSPRRFNPGLPPEFEAAVLRALHKDRRQRFQSAPELAAAVGYRGRPLATWEGREGLPGSHSRMEPTPVPGLVIASASRYGQKIPLTPPAIILGRQSVNPDDIQISRRHAQVLVQSGAIWLEDLNSANGTFHNGRRVFGPVLLQGGDEIRLGNTVLRVER